MSDGRVDGAVDNYMTNMAPRTDEHHGRRPRCRIWPSTPRRRARRRPSARRCSTSTTWRCTTARSGPCARYARRSTRTRSPRSSARRAAARRTVLRCFNRMNDTDPGARVEGTITYHGIDLYGPDVSATEVRRRIGMVFQKPNPFPKSIYDNVAYGPRLAGVRKPQRARRHRREVAARRGAVGRGARTGSRRRRSACPAVSSSGCASPGRIAVEPEVILMDEPCSALDPIATARIEELMQEIKAQYTIVIVTHNMQQAARVQRPHGVLHHRGQPRERPPHRAARRVRPTTKIFSDPARRAHRDVRHREVRMSELRASAGRRSRRHGALPSCARAFHNQLDELRDEIAAMAAAVTESIPRATEILLAQDLEGAEHMVLADDEIDAQALELEERVLRAARPAVAGRQRPPPGRRGDADHRRDRALGRPRRQHLQGGAPDLRPQLDPRLRGIIQKMGEQAHSCSRRRPRRTSPTTRPSRRPRRHGQLPRRPAARVRPGDLHQPRRRADRPAGGGAAGGRRPVLRAHRRPRRQHRRAGPLRRHRVDARAADGAARYAERQAASDLE